MSGIFSQITCNKHRNEMQLSHFENLLSLAIIQVLVNRLTHGIYRLKLFPFIVSIKMYYFFKTGPQIKYFTNLNTSEITIILSLLTCICLHWVTTLKSHKLKLHFLHVTLFQHSVSD